MELNSKQTVMKNTGILYIRMLVTLLVSLYTSRVTLELLGIDDFGVYGLIGGIVGLFAFLTRTLTTSFNRYLCIGIAYNDEQEINHVVGASMIIQMIIIAIVITIGEPVGIWAINNYLVIAPEKLSAAHVVFQFSIATFVVNIFTSAYNSIIISYERMSVYAYICIFEVMAKLVVVYALVISEGNRLEYYAGYIFGVQVLIFVLYYIFVKRQYPNIAVVFSGCKPYIKSMMSFAGFGFVGSFAFVAKNQGLNFLLNIFGGPALNAARSISFQVYTAVYNFVGNFQTAFSPYILKRQELDNENACNGDVTIFTTMSFGIMGMLMAPLIFFIDPILYLWLGDNVPPYTSQFTVFILLIGLCEAISSPLQNIIYGKGKIKTLQIGVFLMQFVILSYVYVLLKKGESPIVVYIVDLIGNVALILFRVFIAARNTVLRVKYYFYHSLLPILIVVVLCVAIYTFTPRGVIPGIIGVVLSEFLIVLLLLISLPRKFLRDLMHKKIMS